MIKNTFFFSSELFFVPFAPSWKTNKQTNKKTNKQTKTLVQKASCPFFFFCVCVVEVTEPLFREECRGRQYSRRSSQLSGRDIGPLNWRLLFFFFCLYNNSKAPSWTFDCLLVWCRSRKKKKTEKEKKKTSRLPELILRLDPCVRMASSKKKKKEKKDLRRQKMQDRS